MLEIGSSLACQLQEPLMFALTIAQAGKDRFADFAEP
jgi:hypothetical protein